jgi:hypothetical protein
MKKTIVTLVAVAAAVIAIRKITKEAPELQVPYYCM